MASYVFGICSKTGWSEKFVYEELSLVRGWMYRHVILSEAGIPVKFINNHDELIENQLLYESMMDDDLLIYEDDEEEY